jgi:hypothetical protein
LNAEQNWDNAESDMFGPTPDYDDGKLLSDREFASLFQDGDNREIRSDGANSHDAKHDIHDINDLDGNSAYQLVAGGDANHVAPEGSASSNVPQLNGADWLANAYTPQDFTGDDESFSWLDEETARILELMHADGPSAPRQAGDRT